MEKAGDHFVELTRHFSGDHFIKLTRKYSGSKIERLGEEVWWKGVCLTLDLLALMAKKIRLEE